MFKITGLELDLYHYRSKQRQVKKITRQAKREYEKDMVKNIKHNSKAFFNYIRGREQVRTSVGPLRNSTRRVVSDEGETAGLLNRYFSSTFTQEQSGELPIAESIFQRGEEGLLQKIQVGVEEVKEQLGNLREDKAPCLDNIYPRVLMEVPEQVSEMLTDIFNRSLESGQVPEDWRNANVTPLFQKESREELGNYRPVSLTSVVGKVRQTLIRGEE